MNLNEKYIEVTFYNISEETAHLFIAQLSEAANGFEEGKSTLKAFFDENKLPKNIQQLAANQGISYDVKITYTQNWNAVWESNFNPVVVDGEVAVRASFHKPINNVRHDIIITPKMSFGTGHHATTHLMIKAMLTTNFLHKSVFDFGTGTGVLAILAKKLGAKKVVASDIDEWCIKNAHENFSFNNATDIQLIQSDSLPKGNQFDLILANINRNVLLENLPNISKQTMDNGIIILSGILLADEHVIVDAATQSNLNLKEKLTKKDWLCLTFIK